MRAYSMNPIILGWWKNYILILMLWAMIFQIYEMKIEKIFVKKIVFDLKKVRTINIYCIL